MTTDKMRAEFEAWAKANDLPIAVLHSGENSGYVDMRTAWAFEGWRVVQKAEQAEVELLRAELADTQNARDSWRRVCEKETEAKHQAWAELAEAVKTLKRNGWGAE